MANDPVNADRGVRPSQRWSRCWPTTQSTHGGSVLTGLLASNGSVLMTGLLANSGWALTGGLLANSGSALTAMLANTAISVDWAVWGRWPSTLIAVLAKRPSQRRSWCWPTAQSPTTQSTLIAVLANDPVNADRGVGRCWPTTQSTLIAVYDPVNAGRGVGQRPSQRMADRY